MKLQYLTICAVLAAPMAFAQGGPNQQQTQKRFGDGTCLPNYLAHYDVNGDGVINAEEAQVMKQARDQIRKQLRTDWDADGDGVISEPEKDQARTRLRQMIEETRVVRFNEADVDDSDSLSYDEFATLPGMANKLSDDDPDNDGMVQTIFDRLDTDDDGLVTLEEFMAAVKQCDQDRTGGN